jgi:hypothetical protein
MFFMGVLFVAKWQLTITTCKNNPDDDPWRDQDSRSGYRVYGLTLNHIP